MTSSGVPYRYATASTTESATARFTPTITVTDFYPVYCFTIGSDNRTLQTYRVSHSGGIAEITIDHRETGSGWIWLGNYYLEAGGANYVEITNESSESGYVIADAIRWGSGVGDISRPGPGSVSGYARDEECQRYWAHKELGINGVGFDSDIWDGGGDDGGDNVRCGGKWAREMNQVPAGGIQVDRWKRVHLEFHTKRLHRRGSWADLSDHRLGRYDVSNPVCQHPLRRGRRGPAGRGCRFRVHVGRPRQLYLYQLLRSHRHRCQQ